ncbi:hypothetical protein FLL45_22025 [Aliikangiella marina]|uniref:Uncharacterized protein n=1 Tax=Aliikangiella marina TaxID=1712262 RepID=A0A545T1A9_9GAMM|nr:hypothetical protein [Aliikangiella marina]TQV71008.1 hypothetical protein FLL45_22025 [Aliikangiella marina]
MRIRRNTPINLLMITLLVFSFDTFSQCKVLTENGGWSAQGSRGIVELEFYPDNTLSIHFIKGDQEDPIVIDSIANWICINANVTVETDGVELVGVLEKSIKTGIWSLTFEKGGIDSLSDRKLTQFRY